MSLPLKIPTYHCSGSLPCDRTRETREMSYSPDFKGAAGCACLNPDRPSGRWQLAPASLVIILPPCSTCAHLEHHVLSLDVDDGHWLKFNIKAGSYKKSCLSTHKYPMYILIRILTLMVIIIIMTFTYRHSPRPPKRRGERATKRQIVCRGQRDGGGSLVELAD